MNRITTFAEGFILILMGCGIAWFALFGDYWLLMNPRYKYLTFAGAVIVVVIGTAALLSPRRSPGGARIALFCIFIAVVMAGRPFSTMVYSSNTAPEEKPKKNAFISDDPEYPAVELMNLYSKTFQGDEQINNKKFMTMGVVKRLPELDGKNEFAVLNILVFCCLADAVAVGFRTPAGDVSQYNEGDWVKIYGVLKKLDDPEKIKPFRLGVINITAINETYVIHPDRILKTAPPASPYAYPTD